MKITLTRHTLLRELSLLDKVVDNKATIPILQNVLLTIWPAGTASFAAMNGSESVLSDDIAATSVETDGPAQLALPADLLHSLARVIPDGEVVIEATKKTHAELRAGTTKIKLPLANPDDFPRFPDVSATIATVPAGQLREIFKQTRYAAGYATKIGINSPCLLVELDTEIRAVGVDSARLALSYRPLETPLAEQRTMVLPARGVAVLEAILAEVDGTAPVAISADENVACFRVGNRLISTRLMAQPFMAWRKVLPKNHTTVVEIPREPMLLALRRLAVTTELRANNRTVKMAIGDGLITLSTSGHDAQGEDRVPVVIKGPDLEVVFNLNFVAEYFALMQTETINGGFRTASDVVEFGPVDPGVTSVIMPMRV